MSSLNPQIKTHSPHAAPSSDRLLLPGLLLLLTLLAYVPAIGAGYIWDDDFYVTQNQTLRTLEGLRDIWLSPMATPQYYPLVHSSFWIEYQLWELEPRGYHFVNILLHVACALLVWKILRSLGWSTMRAWFVAAVFALHPVHVESVAWITERKNVLSGFFYLAALLCYLKFTHAAESEPSRPDPGPPGTAGTPASPRHWRFYALSLLFFIAALLSKTVACSLPAAILVILWWKRGKLSWRDIAPTIPMFIIGAAMGLLTAWIEHAHVGANGEEWNFTFIQRLAIAGSAVCFYIWKLLLPLKLTFIYPRWQIAAIPWQLVFPALLMLVLFLLWNKRNQIGRGPLAALLFFLVTIFPALGFINIYPMRYSLVADHFQYLASLGVLAAVVSLAAEFVKFSSDKHFKPRWILAATVLLCLMALTMRQATIYSDEESLWRDTIHKNPRGWLAWNNLGTIMLRDGQLEEAKKIFEKVIALEPNLFNGYSNMGSTLLELGQPSAAMPMLQKAIALGPLELPTRFGLARAHFYLGEYEQALDSYQQVIRRQPQLIEAHVELAKTFLRMERDAKAAAEFREAMKLDPDRSDVLLSLAWLHATSRDPAMQLGNKAVELAQHAAQLTHDPKANLLDTLAAAYARAGRYSEAIATAQTAAQKAALSHDESLSRAIEQRLTLYRKHQPFTQGKPEKQ